MRVNWRLFAVAVLFALLPALAVTHNAQVITVGRNVQATKVRSNLEHNEVLLAADPRDPRRLLGCSIVLSTKESKLITNAYVSFDGGNTWDLAVSNDRGILSGDPSCIVGNNGAAYFSAIERSETSGDSLLVYRSIDGGKTWHEPFTLLGSVPSVDRPYLAVDNTNGRFAGRVYVYGQILLRGLDGESSGMGLALWRSRDNGASFEGPIVRTHDKSLTFHPANAVVLSDGTFVWLIEDLDSKKRNDGFAGSQSRKADQQNGTLKAVVSFDGGDTLSPAVKISDLYEDWRQESTGIPSLAADLQSANFKDRIYAVWGDGRYGRTQILASYSSDKGRTWSNPHIVTDGQPTRGSGPDEFMPVVAVNSSGVVGVMWYDKRDNPGDSGYYARFTASLDGGETWLPSVRVSEQPKIFETSGDSAIRGGVYRGGSGELTLAAFKYFWAAGGHTAGLAADANGVFHPFWVDNRTGVSQIWTAPVTVKGSPLKNGSPDLSSLDDVSRSVFLELTNCGHQKATSIVSCNAAIKNTSKQILEGPLKVRVVAVASELGEPKILDADNGESGAGAIWDFSSAMKKGSLAPGESSDPKQLRFKIENPRPFRQDNVFRANLVIIDARVFGRIKP